MLLQHWRSPQCCWTQQPIFSLPLEKMALTGESNAATNRWTGGCRTSPMAPSKVLGYPMGMVACQETARAMDMVRDEVHAASFTSKSLRQEPKQVCAQMGHCMGRWALGIPKT